jgi:hypothetical protein
MHRPTRGSASSVSSTRIRSSNVPMVWRGVDPGTAPDIVCDIGGVIFNPVADVSLFGVSGEQNG